MAKDLIIRSSTEVFITFKLQEKDKGIQVRYENETLWMTQKVISEFHNAVYKGLYNGETTDDIFKRNKLRYREDILDSMNEDELVANLFRINKTKQKLLKDNVQGEKKAKDIHYEVGKKVRKAIADIGGMMPEEMSTPKKSLKQLERENKQLENKEMKTLEGIK